MKDLLLKVKSVFQNAAATAGPVIKKIPFKMIFWWTVIIGGGSVLVLMTAVAIDFFSDREGLIESLKQEKQWLAGIGSKPVKPVIEIYSAEKKLIGEFLPERGSRISIKACRNEMDWLKKAAVSSEDREFYEHSGISVRGILRAMLVNLKSLSFRQGGGSITQQLARNLYTDRSPTLYRKVYETYAAFLVEAYLDKDEILCLYLNRIYMGEGRVGAEEASWFYFRKPPQKLTAAEAAMIVGLFPSPVRYSPLNDIKNSLKKQRLVFDTLVRDGHLTEQEAEDRIERFKKQYDVSETEENPHPGTIGAFGASRDFRLNLAPAANEMARNFLFENIPEEIIREGGLKIYTTIQIQRQNAALRSVRSKIDSLRSQLSSSDPGKKVAKRLNGVLVSVTVPDGHITALVGGHRVSEGGTQISRITRMRRQPGSALKGFLYAVALDEEVIEYDQEVVDEKIQIDGYSPRNWYRHYKGPMSLKRAVALSVNTVAVHTLSLVGVGDFRDRLTQALEIPYFESSKRFTGGLSLALGTGELTPMELTRIYGMVLNQGELIRPVLVTEIQDPQGSILYESPPPPQDVEIISPKASKEALYLMKSVVDEEEEGTAGWIGAKKKKDQGFLPFDIAGKSGTVQMPPGSAKRFPGLKGVRDAWFVGMVPTEVTVVWVGNDEGGPFPGGGSATAGRIWADYADKAYTGIEKNFPEIETGPDEEPEETENTTPPPLITPGETQNPGIDPMNPDDNFPAPGTDPFESPETGRMDHTFEP